ncbi:MAG: hypothetical protein WDZ38_02115 [Balneolaceae bacterium]
MIFKKLFGKTIEAAKKSAKQMYGDNYQVFDSTEDGDEKAEITIVVDDDRKNRQKKLSDRRAGKSAGRSDENDVTFEKSVESESESETSGIDEKKIGSELEFLRLIAEQKKKKQTPAKKDDRVFKQVLNNTTDPISSNVSRTGSNPSVSDFYGRDAIRKMKQSSLSGTEPETRNPKSTGRFRPDLTPKKDLNRQISVKSEQNQSEYKTNPKLNKPDSSGNTLLNMFDQSGPKIKKPTPKSGPEENISRHQEREIKALHKRFDKIEALLDSNLISSNIEYISHPAFQQLVKTGINISVVSGWFSKIIKDGVDPVNQTKLFMSKLSGILKEALTVDSTAEPLKYQLFTGPSGSGKTELIMKLALHPEYLVEKNVAVVSVVPKPEKQKIYYTILKPFCEDNQIPYFEVSAGMNISDSVDEWNPFDFVLIDTPSLEIEKEESFKQYWKFRQLLAPLTPLEVHYVVNVSKNRHYFQSSSAIHHPLQPDYIALTHLDEISQWGAIIPFFQEMEASARYISNGKNIPESLETFKPAWFAQKLLQDS